MLKALLYAAQEALDSDPVTDQVTDQVGRMIRSLANGELGSAALMKLLGLSHRPTFRKNHVNPALSGGWIERTQPVGSNHVTGCQGRQGAGPVSV